MGRGIKKILYLLHAKNTGEATRLARGQRAGPRIRVNDALAARPAVERAQRREAAAYRALGEWPFGELCHVAADERPRRFAPVDAACLEEVEVLSDRRAIRATRVLRRVARGESAKKGVERLGAVRSAGGSPLHAARGARRLVVDPRLVAPPRRGPPRVAPAGPPPRR